MAATDAAPGLRAPWRTGGIVEVWRQRRLTWLIAKSQRSRRLYGTRLGRLWDYINPLTQFMVYFVVIGILLGLQRTVENFPLYIFSGLVTVQMFIGGLNGATTAFTKNRLLVRRVAFPRQMLPIAHVVREFVSLGPPVVVLLIACVLLGWSPDATALLAAVGGLALISLFTYGLGLVAGVSMVFVRDTSQVVGVITTLARWATPIIYPWTLVPDRFGDGLITTLYLANPVTIGVFGMREAFWHPTVDEGLPPLPPEALVLGMTVTVVVVVLGHLMLARYQSAMVQRLRWTT